MSHAILLLSCPDQKGITAAVTDFVFQRGGNIVDAAQHVDDVAGIFFMRIEWQLDDFKIHRDCIHGEFVRLAQAFKMSWNLYFTDETVKTAIFVSKQQHCLYDLLFRYKSGQLPHARIDLIVSNHKDAEPLAGHFGIEFLHIPVTPDLKAAAETAQLSALRARDIHLVVLARYHQILSADFIQHYPDAIINIHHSFLPAFIGGNPYAQAYQKGVKLIGATSHYVIEALDQGPIIEQDTVRVNHRHGEQDLIEIGQDLERMVLYRAVRSHLERKILLYSNKTVVFE